MKLLILPIVCLFLALGFVAAARADRVLDIAEARLAAESDPYNQLMVLRAGDDSTPWGTIVLVGMGLVVAGLAVLRPIVGDVRGTTREVRLARKPQRPPAPRQVPRLQTDPRYARPMFRDPNSVPRDMEEVP